MAYFFPIVQSQMFSKKSGDGSLFLIYFVIKTVTSWVVKRLNLYFKMPPQIFFYLKISYAVISNILKINCIKVEFILRTLCVSGS